MYKIVRMTFFQQILGLVFLLYSSQLIAQFKPIVLNNASFEGLQALGAFTKNQLKAIHF